MIYEVHPPNQMTPKPKDRIGKHFCGSICGDYQTNWLFLEYLGNGLYLICQDKGHEKIKTQTVRLSQITN
jgi:hypothetical protein